ncbi:cystathionine gamma-synthase family protein [Salinicoccus roseus]|uniref:homocysteine desulfhydrase n=1 Tax=Salinicoccus roseus TaxID=45670 RepID=A0A265E6R7_9STAP|nr:cystathionine gamma-synthase family protein [Salinicoccus roseus]OZT77284.1 cystathionine gamma-synthase [Salinicoccus roseus]
MKRNVDHATEAVWAGEKAYRVHGASQVPVVNSVAYNYDDLDHWYQVAIGEEDGHIYGRNTNPTVASFEDKIKQMEGAEAATSFSTGMAAISNTLHTFLRPGDRVVSIKDTYGGTNKIFTEFLPKLDIEIELCETGNHEAMENEIRKGCRLIHLETPTNPTVKITDIERIAELAREQDALLVVDNTFATPILQNPLSLGADLVIHSATKFLGGHADALGGVLCGRKDLVEQVFHYREINGATMDPNAAYLMIRGMKTLDLRVWKQTENAGRLAEYLSGHPAVAEVFYPGLEDHPNHEIAKKQMKGFGSMFSFSLHGGMDAVKEVLPRLEFANRAANLGAVETTVGPARTTSHVESTPEERAELGIAEGLIRYSAGIESFDDLKQDLENALQALNVSNAQS